MSNMVESWAKQFRILSKIAEIDPQAAYCAFINGFRSKLTYFIRTIPDICDLHPLEGIMRDELIPALNGGILCSDNERLLMSLPPRMGGMGLIVFHEEAIHEYANSRELTATVRDLVLQQNTSYVTTSTTKKKGKFRAKRESRQNELLQKLTLSLDARMQRLNCSNREKESLNWLTVLPLKDHGFDLNKQNFWDAVRIRYG